MKYSTVQMLGISHVDAPETVSSEDIDQFIVHQVGKAHTEKFARALGVPLGKIFRLYRNHGNIGPAGVPIALTGIGSGINCSMVELVW